MSKATLEMLQKSVCRRQPESPLQTFRDELLVQDALEAAVDPEWDMWRPKGVFDYKKSPNNRRKGLQRRLQALFGGDRGAAASPGTESPPQLEPAA